MNFVGTILGDGVLISICIELLLSQQKPGLFGSFQGTSLDNNSIQIF